MKAVPRLDLSILNKTASESFKKLAGDDDDGLLGPPQADDIDDFRSSMGDSSLKRKNALDKTMLNMVIRKDLNLDQNDIMQRDIEMHHKKRLL